MQWIIEAVKAHVDEDGKLDIDKAEAAIKTAFPKNAVPKDQYNTVADKLKTANETLTKLQDENKDVEALQSQIEEYKKQVADKDAEVIRTRNEVKLKEALREAGATDIDYMTFKLGELETDADGNLKDLDSKIKSLKESDPKWFKADGDDEGQGGDEGQQKKTDYKPVDNKLPGGKPAGETEPASLSDALKQHYTNKK